MQDHKINALNERITITKNELGNRYQVHVDKGKTTGVSTELRFQHGEPDEVGANGLTIEALYAIILDKVRGFQAGPHPCRENAIVITKTEEALHWLAARARRLEIEAAAAAKAAAEEAAAKAAAEAAPASRQPPKPALSKVEKKEGN